jgi:hypothetical protein
LDGKEDFKAESESGVHRLGAGEIADHPDSSDGVTWTGARFFWGVAKWGNSNVWWWCGERIWEGQEFSKKRKDMLETRVVNISGTYTLQCPLIFPRRHEKKVMRKDKMDNSSQALAFSISEKGSASTNRPPPRFDGKLLVAHE